VNNDLAYGDFGPAAALAFDLGVSLGRSDLALENRPTEEQAKCTRVALALRFGTYWLNEYGWNMHCAEAFESGYATGKTDQEGARRRVAIKRAANFYNKEPEA
jgi:hypothetical protein